MTEAELRQKAADTMLAWLGCKRGDATHRKILEIYNSHQPLPRGYRMQVEDNWCAATVSAAAIAAGLTDIMPVECSCSELIKFYKGLGRWVEQDAYRPEVGDLLFYAWKDDGKGDCLKSPNHVGMVTKVIGDVICITEGNMGSYSVCGTRRITRDQRYIRGWACPDYAGKAAKETKEDEEMKVYHYVAEMPAWAQPAATRAIRTGYIKLDASGACTVWECNLQPMVWMDRHGMFDKPAVRE